MIKELVLKENIELYEKYYAKACIKTVYQHPNYLLAEEKAEKYNTYLYLYEEKDDFVIFPSIKRKINDIEEFKENKEEFFDLVTPHEYAGVIASKEDLRLINVFFEEFSIYCKLHNVVFSFIRFNPYGEEYKAAKDYEVKKSVDQIWVNCARDDFEEAFTKPCKRNIKKAISQNLVCKSVNKIAQNREIFVELYKVAMDRLEAKTFFYFSEEYFEHIFNLDFSELFFVYDSNGEDVLAAAILLKDEYNKTAYYHLGCRVADKENKRAMDLLMAEFSKAMQQKKYQTVHLGGGGTENLRRFKEKFSPERVAYYIGYNIFNKKVYSELCTQYCETNPECSESNFLPLYRSKE